MYTIIDITTNRLLFVKFDNEVLEGQVAIEQICKIENPELKDIYWNDKTKEFFLKD
jgi:hypothetical protein